MLGSAGGGGADGAPADDPVTSLDMCVASDCLLAGHGSGRILLWDYLRWGKVVNRPTRAAAYQWTARECSCQMCCTARV